MITLVIFPSFIVGCLFGFFVLAIFNSRKNKDSESEGEHVLVKHYRGKIYEVLTFDALEEITLEHFVVYRNVNEPERVWVKRKESFLENVYELRTGKTYNKFTRLNERND